MISTAAQRYLPAPLGGMIQIPGNQTAACASNPVMMTALLGGMNIMEISRDLCNKNAFLFGFLFAISAAAQRYLPAPHRWTDTGTRKRNAACGNNLVMMRAFLAIKTPWKYLEICAKNAFLYAFLFMISTAAQRYLPAPLGGMIQIPGNQTAAYGDQPVMRNVYFEVS